jgi:hypothetical protein
VLLNASNPNVNFKYSVDDIIWKVRTAYATGNQTPDQIEEIRLELTKKIFRAKCCADFSNRRSCSWYWNSKRKDATLLQGLVAFAKEDYETAEKHCKGDMMNTKQ